MISVALLLFPGLGLALLGCKTVAEFLGSWGRDPQMQGWRSWGAVVSP